MLFGAERARRYARASIRAKPEIAAKGLALRVSKICFESKDAVRLKGSRLRGSLHDARVQALKSSRTG
ncbi:MAG: hypothetical protein C4334_14675 [Pyrinomonas sp.]